MIEPLLWIVGLGNPGSKYQGTRHNAGALFVSMLADQHNCTLQADKKLLGHSGFIHVDGQKIGLLIPNTFMNLSGQSVVALLQFYKLSPANILVAHDELDLPPGTSRFKQGGGHGGHNGLRDIIEKFSGKKDFHRLRIGIGHPGDRSQVVHFVLHNPSKPEQLLIEDSLDEALSAIPLAIGGNWQKAMFELHSQTKNTQ